MVPHACHESEYRPSILVVDDDAHVRQSIVSVLRAAQFVTHEARTVAEAEHAASELVPDAITLDLILPDGPGELVAAHLIAADLLPPTVVVSIAIDSDARHRLITLGVDDFLTKPFDSHELVARVQGALRHGLKGDVIRRAALALDLRHHEVKYAGNRTELPKHAFLMLYHCLLNIGKFATTHDIVHIAWRELHGYSRNLPSIRAGEIRDAFARLGAPHVLEGTRKGYRLVFPDSKADALTFDR